MTGNSRAEEEFDLIYGDEERARRNPYLAGNGDAKRRGGGYAQGVPRRSEPVRHVQVIGAGVSNCERKGVQGAPRRSTMTGPVQGAPRRSASARPVSAVRARRRKELRRKKIMAAILEILLVIGMVLAAIVIVKPGKAAARTPDEGQAQQPQAVPYEPGDNQEKLIQGLPADVFNSHPEWEEDFLTPNEYSRPGEVLPEVKNIFVHYTANPGTSAAQNRSYFEQQKDMHEASVSSHFVIGYNGEILQLVPLDEIAYAVQTRNYDSISIECCYKSENGQFTQETYDSLISLLAWLTDAYGLESSDILRHYDCGGKKCPLYYTEHEDAWEILKRDVDELKTEG